MIVPTMSEKELIEEIISDMPNVVAKSDSLLDKRLRKACIRRTVYPISVSEIITTRRKNKWVVMQIAKTKKMSGDNSIFVFACLFDTPHGLYVYRPWVWDGGATTLNIYPPHFFRRYRERLGLSETGVDLIKRYLRATAIGTVINNVDGNVTHTISEGMCLGVSTIEGSHLLKTFVSNEMLRESQIGIAEVGHKMQAEQLRELMREFE